MSNVTYQKQYIADHIELVLAVSMYTFLHFVTRATVGQFLPTGTNGIAQIKPSKFSRLTDLVFRTCSSALER